MLAGPIADLLKDSFRIPDFAELREWIRRWRTESLILAIAALGAVAGLGLLSAALVLALSSVVGTPTAAALTGIVVLLVAAIVASTVRSKTVEPPSTGYTATSARRANSSSAVDLGVAAGDVLRRSGLRGSELIVASLVAGIVLGARNDRRASPAEEDDSDGNPAS